MVSGVALGDNDGSNVKGLPEVGNVLVGESLGADEGDSVNGCGLSG